jgi:hypothetical protein
MSTITFTIRANDGSYNAVEAELDKPGTRERLEDEVEDYNEKYMPITYKLVKWPNMIVGGSFGVTITTNKAVPDAEKTKGMIKDRFNKENSGTFVGAEIQEIEIVEN